MDRDLNLALNPALDATKLADEYAANGRVRIRNFMSHTAAEALHTALRSRPDWVQVVNSGDRTLELSRETRAAMTVQQTTQLDDAIYAGARAGFQYRYESIRVPDGDADRQASADPLAAFARWLSGGAPRAFLRTVTGSPEIDFADAQATAYSPGDFLTGHDDAVTGKGRHAAYVFGLNPVWRVEWGGLLLFHPREGGLIEGMAPEFNCLNLFRVPQMHSVSQVTRAAAYRRYSITGWLRAR